MGKREAAEGSRPLPTDCGKVGCRAACPQAAVPVCGNEKPCQIIVGGGVPDAPRRGQDPSLRTCWKRTPFARAKPAGKPPHQGRWPRSRPEGFSPLTGSIARLRAGHARPLRTAVNWLRTRGAREGGSPPPFPLTGGDARPVGTLQASQARPAPLMGSLFPLAGVRGNTRI